MGQRAAPVMIHLVLVRLHVTPIFPSSHHLQRLQQSNDAVLIHQTDEVIVLSSLAVHVLTAGGPRGPDRLLFCWLPFSFHSSSSDCAQLQEVNLRIVLVPRALQEVMAADAERPHACGHQTEHAGQQMVQFIFKSSRNLGFQSVTLFLIV